MKSVFILVCATLLSVLGAQASTGFTSGDEFRAYPISGEITLRCSDQEVRYTCRSVMLEPVLVDYFMGPDNVQADAVVLVSRGQDSVKRTIKVPYDSRQQRTIHPVNLWRSNLFQAAFLRDGKNEISYKLMQKDKTVSTGKFKVEVQKMAGRNCPSDQFEMRKPEDCRAQFTACQKYFEANNFCQ